MNLLNRYLRSLCEEGRGKKSPKSGRRRVRMSWFDYWKLLIKRHEKLIAKYAKTIYPEETYSRVCAKKLPLSESCKKRIESNCESCMHYEPEINKIHRYMNNAYDQSEVALQCWISVFEDPKKNLDLVGEVPAFLKKKDVPGFLKKK